MKKLLTIALFLITVITVSLNADKANHITQTVQCNDGTTKKVTGEIRDSICAQHGGVWDIS